MPWRVGGLAMLRTTLESPVGRDVVGHGGIAESDPTTTRWYARALIAESDPGEVVGAIGGCLGANKSLF